MTASASDLTRRTVLAAGVVVGSISISGCLGFPTDEEPGPPADSEPEPDGEPAVDDETDRDRTELTVDIVADGLSHPWAIGFVPDSSLLLVTERTGRLGFVDRDTGEHHVIDGLPSIYVAGQGGLLDLTFHPEFPDNGWVYVTYSAANSDGSTTHLARGRLDIDARILDPVETLFVAEPYLDGDGHYGSRVHFGPDGLVYMTIGDRRQGPLDATHPSQDRSNAIGTTIRLRPDGSIPDDNPFIEENGVESAIWSYGHRNAQGMTTHPETDAIWQSEHGQRDGDELNIIERGGNYGWPVAHTGCQYGTEDPVGDDPFERDDIVNPVYHWECTSGGFPPAGMTFYDADAIPEFRNDLFVGNLAGRYLGRFSVDGETIEEMDPLLDDRDWRIRDVAVAPDTGHLYVVVDDDGAPIARIRPSE